MSICTDRFQDIFKNIALKTGKLKETQAKLEKKTLGKLRTFLKKDPIVGYIFW